jgi:hypothetical protein
VIAAAVDRTGAGLGRGYFDKTIGSMQHCPPVYAVVFDTEILDEVPRDVHDQPVTGVVTPTRTVDLASPGAETHAPEDTMPTYAYACTQCGHRFDAVQSFSMPLDAVSRVRRRAAQAVRIRRRDLQRFRLLPHRLAFVHLRRRRWRVARATSTSSKSEAKSSPVGIVTGRPDRERPDDQRLQRLHHARQRHRPRGRCRHRRRVHRDRQRIVEVLINPLIG